MFHILFINEIFVKLSAVFIPFIYQNFCKGFLKLVSIHQRTIISDIISFVKNLVYSISIQKFEFKDCIDFVNKYLSLNIDYVQL